MTTPVFAIRDVLLGAADDIERRGWWGGVGGVNDSRDAGSEEGVTCAELSISGYCDNVHLAVPTLEFLADFLGLEYDNHDFHLPTPVGAIIKWNDAQPDGATVIAALRAAAATA